MHSVCNGAPGHLRHILAARFLDLVALFVVLMWIRSELERERKCFTSFVWSLICPANIVSLNQMLLLAFADHIKRGYREL